MQKDNRKITLEEMLSLKKAEMPSVAQWENFNDQLKSKMLKSIVEERQSGFLHSPWALAKLSAVLVPAFCVMVVYFANSDSIENIALQNSSIEIVQIPNIETSYCADNYFSTKNADTQYLQNMIQSQTDASVVYATNDVSVLNHLGF